jgi:hypothetical protein
MKDLNKYLESQFKTIYKKMAKINRKINIRKEKSKVNFPNTTVLEIETVEDWVELAGLTGEYRALTKLKRRKK